MCTTARDSIGLVVVPRVQSAQVSYSPNPEMTIASIRFQNYVMKP